MIKFPSIFQKIQHIGRANRPLVVAAAGSQMRQFHPPILKGTELLFINTKTGDTVRKCTTRALCYMEDFCQAPMWGTLIHFESRIIMGLSAMDRSPKNWQAYVSMSPSEDLNRDWVMILSADQVQLYVNGK